MNTIENVFSVEYSRNYDGPVRTSEEIARIRAVDLRPQKENYHGTD